LAIDFLDNTDDYQFWRDEKLSNAQSNIEDCLIEIRNPQALSNILKTLTHTQEPKALNWSIILSPQAPKR
jgi:hypothetical protein